MKSEICQKGIRILAAVLLACFLTLFTGCTHDIHLPIPSFPWATTESTPTEPKPTQTVPPTTEVPAADASLTSLRQAMVETPQFFAVAYLGYHHNWDSDLPVDPYEALQAQVPELCADLPFLLQIPKSQVIGENGDLFCIVPLDTDATVAVSAGYWDEENQQYIYDNTLYSSGSGAPILVFCNNGGWEPDIQLQIAGPSGFATWYPQLDDNHCAYPLRDDDGENVFLDFSPYRELLITDYQSMKENPEWEGILPTEETLIGNTWVWNGFSKTGLETSCMITFSQDYLTVRWKDGIDPVEHIYENAAWELTHQDGFAVLSIDFQEFAGVLRYNILYSEFYGDLHVAMDVLQEDMPIGEEPLYRYMMKPIAPTPAEMIGTWELVWTEMEGYREHVEPGRGFIEITADSNDLFRISYTDYVFPEQNYADKELIVFPFELYYGCGNDQWLAAVNYDGKYGTEYTITLLYDDTLVLQRYWEMDGAPSVSYEYYHRTVG